MKRLLTALCLSLPVLIQPALAHESKAGEVRIVHPYSLPSLPGVPNAAAFVDLTNNGKAADRLLKASSPAAERVEIHEMKMEGDVMKMRELASGIEIKPGQTVKMAPGGLHIMMLGLKQPLKVDDKFPLTLSFEKGGNTTVEVWVQTRDTGAKAMEAHHHKH